RVVTGDRLHRDTVLTDPSPHRPSDLLPTAILCVFEPRATFAAAFTPLTLRLVRERIGVAGIVAALSVTSDLPRGHPPGEAMRACLLATELARRAGLDPGPRS